MSLGGEQSINLGVFCDKVVKRIIIVVAMLISISKELVETINF
ncbi:hypothetical protein [Clostridium tetanomorphum]|nr:hypothetical protein [Clostridium tetanomorphum]NRZ99554.1 ABC-type enterochelin transport system permease subunit [Clostridium tetanomorphum]